MHVHRAQMNTNPVNPYSAAAEKAMAAQRAAEDGVVPVHRPTFLVEETLRAVGDRDGERSERQLPVGAFPPEPAGTRDRAAQARPDARLGRLLAGPPSPYSD